MKILSICISLLAVTFVFVRGHTARNENSEPVAVTKEIAACRSWHAAEPHPSMFLKQTRNCPCQVSSKFPTQFSDGSEIWKVDPGCVASKQPNTCKYHKGAHGCYRFAYKSKGPSAQCCYDKAGAWIKDPHRGAGTLDREGIPDSILNVAQWLAHNTHDVKPWEDCCKHKDMPRHICNLYFEKRPPGKCQQYEILSARRDI